MHKKNKEVNHTLTSDRKKKKHIIRKTLLALFGLVVVVIAGIIIFRDPIVETIAEKVLTKSLKTPVEITNLHITLLNPGISIEQVRIDHKTDPNIYMLKTGFIKITIKIKPYLTQKRISVPELILNKITLNAPKPNSEIRETLSTETSTDNDDDSTQEEQGSVGDLVDAIDPQEIIDKYLSNISTLSQIDNLSAEVDSFYIDSQNTIDKSIAQVNTLETKYNSLSNQLSSVSLENLDSVNAIVSNTQSILEEGKQISNEIINTQKKGERYIKKSTQLSNSLTNSIQADTDKILAQITNPKELGLDLAIQLVEDMLDADIASYEKMLSTALSLLVNFRESLDNPDDNIKDPSEKKQDIDFLVDYFHLSFGLGLNPLFNIEATHVTNKLYTSTEPTEFTILATAHDISIEGNGSLSLHPNAAIILTTNVRYKDIPLAIEAIPEVELYSINGKLGGTIDLEYRNATNGKLAIGIVIDDAVVEPIEDSTFGPHVANGIVQNYPIDLLVSGETIDGKLSNLKVESTFFNKISDVLAQIIQEQIEVLTADVQKKIQEAVREQAEAKLEEIGKDLGLSTDAIKDQIASVTDVNGNINSLFSNANKKVAEAVESQIKEEVEAIVEDIGEEVVEEVKKFIPSF